MTPPAWAPGRPTGIRGLSSHPATGLSGPVYGDPGGQRPPARHEAIPCRLCGPASLALGGRPGPTPGHYGRGIKYGHLLSSTRGAGSSSLGSWRWDTPPLNPILYRKPGVPPQLFIPGSSAIPGAGPAPTSSVFKLPSLLPGSAGNGSHRRGKPSPGRIRLRAGRRRPFALRPPRSVRRDPAVAPSAPRLLWLGPDPLAVLVPRRPRPSPPSSLAALVPLGRCLGPLTPGGPATLTPEGVRGGYFRAAMLRTSAGSSFTPGPMVVEMVMPLM